MKTPVQQLIIKIEELMTIKTFQKWEGIKKELLHAEKNLLIEIYQDGFQENIRPRHEDAIEYLQSKFESI